MPPRKENLSHITTVRLTPTMHELLQRLEDASGFMRSAIQEKIDAMTPVERRDLFEAELTNRAKSRKGARTQ